MSVDRAASGDDGYALVDVGGYRPAIHCIGEGGPAVVLDTGLGAPSEYWAPVQQEVAGLTRVCRFDRTGRGKSDPAPTTPRTCADMVADLRALLRNAGIRPLRARGKLTRGHRAPAARVRIYSILRTCCATSPNMLGADT